jgi:CheY-like chemotaxis protein
MKTILQVEGDPNEVFFFKRAMNKAGEADAIRVVKDGHEAIEYLRGAGKFADREIFPFPSLVLLDLKLPYVMGLDVLRWIREQPATAMAVIVLTESAEDIDIADAYRLGVSGFLTKPSEASKFDEMVKAIRDFWLIHNTLPQQSYEERAVAPTYSGTTAPGAKSLPATIGSRREEWHPMMSKQTYEETPNHLNG